MAVVTKYGSAARDPASLVGIEAIFAAAEVRVINSLISIANGDSINSLFYIGKAPSNAILDVRGQYWYQAITGVSDFDVGLYYEGGALIDIDALIDGDDISSAGNQTIFGHGTIVMPNFNRRLWQHAGLSSDPGGNFDIVGTLKAAATAAGSVQFVWPYHKGA